jgi:hypothetical protein
MIGVPMTVFESAPGILWLKDAGQTLVVDPDAGSCRALTGVEATIWDLLALGYPHARLTATLAVVLSVAPGEAADRLAGIVRGWAEAGLLRAVKEDGDG